MRKIYKYFTFLSVTALMLSTVNAQDVQTIREASFPTKSGEKLEVIVQGGDVVVKSWDKEEVEVIVKGNEKAAKKMSFEIEKTDEGVRVESNKLSGSIWNLFSSFKLKVYVTVPAKYDLKLKTSGGDIDVKNVEGNSYLGTSGGDISFTNGIGESQMSTSGGDIIVNNFSGPVNLSTSGGDIQYSGKESDVDASTSGGDIVIKTSNGRVKGETSGGDIKLTFKGENKGIYLATSGGDIVAELGADVSGYVEAKSSGGDIDNHNSGFKADKITSHSMKGTLNSGGESITLKTSGGDVIIR
jgi:hypothetical protein